VQLRSDEGWTTDGDHSWLSRDISAFIGRLNETNREQGRHACAASRCVGFLALLSHCKAEIILLKIIQLYIFKPIFYPPIKMDIQKS